MIITMGYIYRYIKDAIFKIFLNNLKCMVPLIYASPE